MAEGLAVGQRATDVDPTGSIKRLTNLLKVHRAQAAAEAQDALVARWLATLHVELRRQPLRRSAKRCEPRVGAASDVPLAETASDSHKEQSCRESNENHRAPQLRCHAALVRLVLSDCRHTDHGTDVAVGHIAAVFAPREARPGPTANAWCPLVGAVPLRTVT